MASSERVKIRLIERVADMPISLPKEVLPVPKRKKEKRVVELLESK